MHHRLLVAGEDVGKTRAHPRFERPGLVLQQRLADAGDVAVSEDAEAAGEQPLALAVALGPLGREELDGRLRHREPGRPAHEVPPIGSRGSTSCPAQVSRTQPWLGSSQISQARVSPGPAITLR